MRTKKIEILRRSKTIGELTNSKNRLVTGYPKISLNYFGGHHAGRRTVITNLVAPARKTRLGPAPDHARTT